jgi:transcriptional regulator with PAS, ATPase and Fis domain
MDPDLSVLIHGEDSLKETLKHHADISEKNMINQALKESEGNKSKAARKLRVDYKTLLRKIKAHQIE